MQTQAHSSDAINTPAGAVPAAHAASAPAAGTATGAQSYWALLNAGEPYRLLFPLGTLLGIIGVMLWVTYVLGWQQTYPSIMHARIMIEGFLGAFAFGFLGTAFPRLTETARLRGSASIVLAVGLSLCTLLHLLDKTAWGDLAFVLTFLYFIALLAPRAARRADNPPPGFVLVAAGLLSGLVGAAGLLAAQYMRIGPAGYSMFSLLLYQGFMLMPVMGVGAFLLPRFFGLPNRQSFPESLLPSKEWLRRAGFALLCAAGVILSFLLEANGFLRSGSLLRAAAVLLYLITEVPVHRATFSQGSLALSLRIALLCLPLSYVVVAIAPHWRIAWLHILFITGFSLITLTVATRVILGHSGQSHHFKAKLRPVTIMLGCLLLALATRISADWMPDSQLTHYAYAAVTWAVGAIVWAIAYLPAIRIADEE